MKMPELALEKVEVINAEVVDLPITQEEQQEHDARLNRCLELMQDIGRSSNELWEHIKWIRDHKTFRNKYKTFNVFCRYELSKDNSVIYRMIRDSEFKENLLLEAHSDEERSTILNLKEGNTRFLRTLPEESQIPFWQLAYSLGTCILPKKEDGSIEPTTAFLESVGERLDEIMQSGTVNIDGSPVPIGQLANLAEATGTNESTIKTILLSLGVSEEYFELLKRQEQHIKEKSMKADVISLKGTVELKIDINGSEYPIILDSKNNEVDVNEVLLSFAGRWVNFSLRVPLKD